MAAEAEAVIAQNDASRLLASGDSVSQQQRENAEQFALAAAARVKQVTAQLAELTNGTRPELIQQQEAVVAAMEAQRELAAVQVDQTFLRAPFAGLITQRFIDVGAVVQPGQAVYAIQDNGPREVHLTVPRDIPASTWPSGTPVSLHTDIGNIPAKFWVMFHEWMLLHGQTFCVFRVIRRSCNPGLGCMQW